MQLNTKDLKRKKDQVSFNFEGWGNNGPEGVKIVGHYKVCTNVLGIMLHSVKRQISTSHGENMYAQCGELHCNLLRDKQWKMNLRDESASISIIFFIDEKFHPINIKNEGEW